MARRAAPFVAFGPAAIWQAVSADAMFAAVAAWGVACLALAATRRSIAWSLLAGVLLGYSVMLSYGLTLLGVLAIAVLVAARSWFPLVFSVVAAVAVVGTFALFGFNYLEALPGGPHPLLRGGRRAAACVVLDVGRPGGARVQRRARSRSPVSRSCWGACAATSGTPRPGSWCCSPAPGVAMVVLADLSQMSKAEVERVWLPFAPWLLVSCALLPEQWRRRGLVLQLALAVVVQHLLATGW